MRRKSLPSRRTALSIGTAMLTTELFKAVLCNIEAQAQLSAELATGDFSPPQESANADFSQVWEMEDTSAPAAPFLAPDLPPAITRVVANEIVSSYDDVLSFFSRRTGSSFIQFFNDRCSGRGEWRTKRVSASNAEALHASFWRTFIQAEKISILTYLSYNAVFLNECDGILESKSERFGSREHAGLSYLFNDVWLETNGRRWRKRSYNGGGNKTAYRCFSDIPFVNAHRHLRFGDMLGADVDPRWDGNVYPVDRFPTSGDLSLSGCILEADFHKFRGRGLIQTTWRQNYKSLIPRILSYSGDSLVLNEYKRRWSGLREDIVCDISSSRDWDRLFSEETSFLLVEAVRTHAALGRYVPLSRDGDIANGVERGSVAFFGNSIGGGGYGQRLKARVGSLLAAL